MRGCKPGIDAQQTADTPYAMKHFAVGSQALATCPMSCSSTSTNESWRLRPKRCAAFLGLFYCVIRMEVLELSNHPRLDQNQAYAAPGCLNC